MLSRLDTLLGDGATVQESVAIVTRLKDGEADLAERFATMLGESGADPTRLLLEITETALMADVEANLRVLRRLADLGLRVAVDDFGTGYSSLAQLTRLPVDVLKIDRAFVDGIDKSAESRTVIRAIIGLGRGLGMTLVAEGVETAAQQHELCALGCDNIQGYLFHRPLMHDVFVKTVSRGLLDVAPSEDPALYFLIYVSRETTHLSTASRQRLLKQSRMANRSGGISGCLVAQNGCFMQMLEGRREALAALMQKIKADPRHREVRVVIEGPAQQRVFPDWGMVMRDLDTEHGAPDFTAWQQRKIDFMELADDARTCFDYITAYAAGDSIR